MLSQFKQNFINVHMHILKFKIFIGRDLQAGGFIEAGDDIFFK